MRRLPPLRALQVFETAANFDSFTKAAEALCVTHGAVSHQIRVLEAWLDEALFVRRANGIHLTEAGAALQAVCTEAFGTLEVECLRIRHGDAEKRVRVGCSGSFIGHWLIPCLKRFEQVHPEVMLDLRVEDDLAALASHRVDVIINGGPAPRSVEIAATRLAHDIIGPVCAANWTPLPRSGQELQGAMLHTTSRPLAWQDWARAAGQPLVLEGGRRFDSLTLTLEAARRGLGFAIAPELLVRRELETGVLQAPFGFHNTGASIYFCTRTSGDVSAPIRCLLSWLSKETGD
jgi:LysR family transcriptional regulator, glycine cleavage system transcriptional activator